MTHTFKFDDRDRQAVAFRILAERGLWLRMEGNEITVRLDSLTTPEMAEDLLAREIDRRLVGGRY